MESPMMRRKWTVDDDALLRRLSEEGVTTAAIGRALGVTKNAVCGRRGRLSLPKRPSPIKKRLLPRTGLLGGIAGLLAHQCRFPIGEGAEMTFCTATAVEWRPYCAEHMRRTHVSLGRVSGKLPATYWIKARVSPR